MEWLYLWITLITIILFWGNQNALHLRQPQRIKSREARCQSFNLFKDPNRWLLRSLYWLDPGVCPYYDDRKNDTKGTSIEDLYRKKCLLFEKRVLIRKETPSGVPIVADLGRKACAHYPQSNFFHFHAAFGNNYANYGTGMLTINLL